MSVYKIINNRNKRLHGMDCLRVFAALLGIILHSALPYGNIYNDLPWPNLSQAHSVILNILAIWIHMFHTPIFFMLSGFFAYVIYNKSGSYPLALNRIKRILIPFLVFWLGPSLIYILIFVIQNTYMHGHFSIDIILKQAMFLNGYWFLYYLLLMYIATLLLIRFNKTLPHRFKLFLAKFSRLAILSLLFIIAFICQGLYINNWYQPSPIQVKINIPVFFSFSLFYLAGWILAGKKNYMDALLRIPVKLFFIIAFIIFTIFTFLYLQSHSNKLIMHIGAMLYYSCAWMTTLAWFCLFNKIIQAENKLIRYLAESSYWLYLTQIPIIVFLQTFFMGIFIPFISKFILIMIISFLICIFSYHLLVRNRKYISYIDGHKPKTISLKPLITRFK